MPSCVLLLYYIITLQVEIHPPYDLIFSLQHLVESGSFIAEPLAFETGPSHKGILGVQRGVEFLSLP